MFDICRDIRVLVFVGDLSGLVGVVAANIGFAFRG